ncbi:helix-turn-helix transcriptional regulator [Ornithinimicrobium sediminis]|uniref:helix-turn-helix transcriptional regulator n=1 Tax=Ornithinimicrobium sediminis TaxID=2904603 RepID=UPI001E47F1E2|nr:helix-turn-helix domain-containing protein [Ornithinimicrobium sediminis]MCE0488123.1 helix-turn-helix domain-containing protein [Ornithinimicrobium sediminis]
MDKELLTLYEVAERLGVPAATLRWWRHVGTGPRGFRAGRRVYYRPVDVDRWVEEQWALENGRDVQ